MVCLILKPSAQESGSLWLNHGAGKFTYSATAGHTSVGPEAQPIKKDAVFLLASQTKLVASVAALQAVEQGLIGLDDDVAEIVPELAKQPILKGFEGDEPILAERKNAITLRCVAARHDKKVRADETTGYCSRTPPAWPTTWATPTSSNTKPR